MEIFSKRRKRAIDIEIQNNNNIVDDSKNKSVVLTKDLNNIKKPKQGQGKMFLLPPTKNSLINSGNIHR